MKIVRISILFNAFPICYIVYICLYIQRRTQCSVDSLKSLEMPCKVYVLWILGNAAIDQLFHEQKKNRNRFSSHTLRKITNI